MKKTLIIGASTNPDRYAYKAAHMLKRFNHDIVNVGIKTGRVADVPIEKPSHIYNDIDTVTLYIGVPQQKEYFDYVLKTKPKRVIFNPGTENPEFEQYLNKNGIETTEACTLVLLSTGQF
jgi:predicted CoA-binding protein